MSGKSNLYFDLFDSAVTAGLANIVSQKIVKRGKSELVEYRSVIAFSTFGFCVSGPLIHYFYERLDKIIPRKAPYAKYKRLLVDRGLFSPLFLLVFFYTVAILEGKSHKEAVMKIRQMYWTALKMSWRVWIVFQYVNLNYVPIQYRVLCGNMMSFLWSIYLASKRAQIKED
ncbi:Mpv17 / PMP22 [Desmophyllum pertusum]|uniref:Mpv17 / PMP22 n=1 Tax=Desmophyllum pertusum TaxID=174260 RepID=A0A9W9ZS93_9CNID|nr:Mpv17 / PMP22 [Desmophyllum pertusum]